MDTKEFDQKLVDKINEAKISPKPRWYFLLKNYAIWAAGFLALLAGSLAVSVMIYLIRYNGWETRIETHKSLWEFLLMTLPYFWIIFLGIFVFILYYNFKHTKGGYRYPVYLVAIFSVLVSIILGAAFYFLGLGQKIDNILGERAPLYEKVLNPQMAFWFNPEEGRLVGIIASEVVDNNFHIIDPSGSAWQILGREDKKDSHLNSLLKAGQPVNIVGYVVEENNFQAENIRPIVPGRGFFSRPEMKKHRERCLKGGCVSPSPNINDLIR
ncbi:MAG: hypothetical protein WCJ57_03440 [Candidatus Falkowbacteria bacterium]